MLLWCVIEKIIIIIIMLLLLLIDDNNYSVCFDCQHVNNCKQPFNQNWLSRPYRVYIYIYILYTYYTSLK